MRYFLRAVCFLIATVALAQKSAYADDSAAITTAIDNYYQGTVYSSISWTNVVINEVAPYAIFYADNGETSIDTLVEDVNGTWEVSVPSKGILQYNYLTTTAQVGLFTAGTLLGDGCVPDPRRNPVYIRFFRVPADNAPLNRPVFYEQRVMGRAVKVRVVRTIVPAIVVHKLNPYSRRWETTRMKPFTTYYCLA